MSEIFNWGSRGLSFTGNSSFWLLELCDLEQLMYLFWASASLFDRAGSEMEGPKSLLESGTFWYKVSLVQAIVINIIVEFILMIYLFNLRVLIYSVIYLILKLSFLKSLWDHHNWVQILDSVRILLKQQNVKYIWRKIFLFRQSVRW